MNKLEYDKDSLTKQPWEHYRKEYAGTDPHLISERLGLPYAEETHTLMIRFLGSTYQVSHPDFTVAHVPDEQGFYPLETMIKAKILTLRYLLNGTKAESSGAFRTYREMPWGEIYLRQFDGRCIKRLAFTYGNRLADFERVMQHMHADRISQGDMSYELEIYPDYRVRMILWEGDEEFPPSSQFLFSDNFPLSFEAEDIAQMGDVLIGSLKSFLACSREG